MNYKEIEYKYWANNLSKEDFAKRIEHVIRSDGHQSLETSLESPKYVVSCDDYYTINKNKKKDFVRFRKGGGIYELTLKRKEKENVIRKEINLNVSANEDSAVVEFLTLSGYKKEFQVYKEAWIWDFKNCDISYYTLSDGRSVIELEAKDYSKESDGLKIIKRWEALLELKKLAKESRSLYEIFTEEMNEIK